MGWATDQKILELLHEISASQQKILTRQVQLGNSQLKCCAQLNDKLDKILAIFVPPPAVSFAASAIAMGESVMKKALLAGDVAVLDNGLGVMIAVDALDAAGQKTAWPTAAPAPTVAEVDPTGSTGPYFGASAAPVATATGFTITVPLASPVPGLATGIQFNVTVDSGFPNQTAPETIQLANAIDVVAGPANSFVAQDSAA